MKYLEVAVPLPLFQSFTYLWPQLGEVQPGSRVLVPFGSRTVTGLVMEQHERTPEEPVKEIEEVLDSEPLLSSELMALGEWMTRYYFSPPGETYRVMLPPGLLTRKTATLERPRQLWPAKLRQAVVSVSRLRDPDQPPVTEKQAAVLRELSGRVLPVLVQTFARETGFKPGVLKSLEKKGLVSLGPVEVMRTPWGDSDPVLADSSRFILTKDQSRALDEIETRLNGAGFSALLLHGVTGSGKTEVYLGAIEKALESGRSALMLVPEIGLTPQVSQLFRQRFGSDVAIQHSGLSDGERFDQWRQIRDGSCRVVVGTRSAVFAPVQNVGVIVVDEEHDTSYKQDEMPRYHGRDTALMRGKIEKALVILGSATPQLETCYQALEKKRFGYQPLPDRILNRPLPTVHIVDMRTEFERHGKEVLISGMLADAVGDRISKKQQVLLLLNRRGYSPAVICRSCGHVETCKNCSISLTYHLELHRCICHYCGYARSVPRLCSECEKKYIHFFGVGTEKIQEIVQGMYPDAVVGRLDRDTTQRKGSFRRILGAFARGKTDILIGTQMIAKGHDFPNVTLVGVIAADQGLKLGDFRAAERTFQLLTQVSGRAGRGAVPGEVVVQTYYPDHYSLKYACAQDYELFYRREIVFRRNFRYPPYTALANFVVRGDEESSARELAEKIGGLLLEGRSLHSSPNRMRILGPAPAPIQKLKRDFRFQILVKTTNRLELHEVLKTAVSGLSRKESRGVLIDVDPTNLL